MSNESIARESVENVLTTKYIGISVPLLTLCVASQVQDFLVQYDRYSQCNKKKDIMTMKALMLDINNFNCTNFLCLAASG